MVGSFGTSGRFLSGAGRLTLVALTAGLTFSMLGMAARAQQNAGPFDALLEKLQVKGQVASPAPFIRQGRPAQDPGYMPVGAPHRERSIKAMTPAEVAAVEADLDAARERQQRRAGQKPAVVPLKDAKGGPPGRSMVR